MKATVLQQLVCPETGQALSVSSVDADHGQVLEGSLRCNGQHAYPIVRGVPRFVADRDLNSQTARSFASKWKLAAHYRAQTSEFYTDWFLQRYGFGDLDTLASLLGQCSNVLDAGTGAGRDAANFARLTQGTVFAIDLTGEAIANAQATIDAPNVEFIQADVNRLPFPDGHFDFINCDQVIHHTPDPHAAFRHLAAKLRRGGQICVYVYRRKAPIREFADDHVRDQIKDLDFEEAMRVCESITHLGRVLSSLNVSLTIEHDIPILGIKSGTYDLQRFFHWHVLKCFWRDDFDFESNNVVNTDWYHPTYCFRFDEDEFRAWFDDGWEIIHWDAQESGFSCRARKK